MFPGETILSGAVKDEHVSDFTVLRSGAGWYIGTLFIYCGRSECTRCDGVFPEGYQEPNTRETDYFASEEEAKRALSDYHDSEIMPKQRT